MSGQNSFHQANPQSAPQTLTTLLVEAFAAGTLSNDELFGAILASREFTVASGVAAQAYAGTPPDAETTIDLKRNDVVFGTVVWAIGSNTGVVDVPTTTSFYPGDRLTFVQNGTADASLADIMITLEARL